VAAGRVYLQYFEPSGDAVDPRHARAPVDKRPESWKIDALDVVLCADAATGKTLWKARLPHGRNVGGYGRGGSYQHPVIVGRRAYVQGTAGWAHAIDAETGKTVWSAPLGPGEAHWRKVLATARRKKDAKMASQGPAFNVSPAVADGVVVCNDQFSADRRTPDHGMVGLDADTGALRWVVTNALGRMVTPVIWNAGGGTAFAIGACKTRLVGVNVKTGEQAWELPGPYHSDQTPSIRGDMLVVARIGFRSGLQKQYGDAKRRGEVDKQMSYAQWLETGKGLTAYRLSADDAPEELWTLPIKYGSGNTGPALCGRYGFFHTTVGLSAIELATGDVQATGAKAGPYIALKAMGDRLFQYGRMWDISAPPRARPAGSIGSVGGFKTVVYADGCVAGGRLYLRGWIADDSLAVGDAPERGCLACFDLRKGVIRGAVSEVLEAGIGEGEKLAALVELAWHQEAAVRADAVRAIGAMDGMDAARGLARIIGADAIDARELAVDELTQHARDAAVRGLVVAQLAHDNPEVRARAAQVLGNLRAAARDALPAMIKLAADEHPDVRRRLGLALTRVAGRDPLPVECVPALFTEARQGLADRAYAALDTIARIGSPAIPFLLKAMENEEAGFIRWRAAYAVGKMGAPAVDAIPELERIAATTDHPNVRKTIRTAIEDIRKAAAEE
jgi:outer membrane protein assembly factor BamB/HEAT repeat protein